MPRQRLTLPRIAAFKPKSEGFLWDEDAPQLAVRVRASGSKSFIFQSGLGYRDIRITIGSVDVWTIEAAREEARRYQRMIDEGKDPREVLRQDAEARKAEEAARQSAAEAEQKELQRRAVTVGEAWAAYVTARSHKWGDSHKRDHEKAIQPGGQRITRGRKKGQGEFSKPGMVYPLLGEALKDLTSERLAAWMRENNERGPTEAAKNYRLFRAFLNWCVERPEYSGIVRPDACRTSEVKDHVRTVKAKGDSLQREQLSLWFEHVRALRNPVHSAYLQTALLTGARREELTGMRWEDVDFRWLSITIKDKVDGQRTIPLTPYVASLLEELPRRNEWVFSSPTAEDGRLQEPLKPHKKAMEAAGLPPFTLHDLRRSFGTLAEWVECPVGIVAQIQGHKPSALAEKHYRRRPLDLLRVWHVKIEAWILNEADLNVSVEERRRDIRVIRA